MYVQLEAACSPREWPQAEELREHEDPRTERSKGSPVGLEQIAEPKELAGQFFEGGDRTARRSGQQLEEVEQTMQLGRIEFDSECVEIKSPADPRNSGGQSGFVPTHWNTEHTQKDDQKSGQQRGG